MKFSEETKLRAEIEQVWMLLRAERVGAAAQDEKIRVLREALQGVMDGNVYSCIQGQWHWHTKSMPSNDSLDKARAALEKNKMDDYPELYDPRFSP